VRPAKWVAKRWLGLVSPPVILAVVVASIPLVSGCIYRRAKTPTSLTQLQEHQAALAKQASALHKTSPAEKLTNALSDMTGPLAGARKKLARGKWAGRELTELRGMQADLIRIDREVRSDFAHTRKMLTRIHSPEKDSIETSVEAAYARRMTALASDLALVTTAHDTRTQTARMAALSSFIASVTPEPPHQPLGTQLPHRIVDYHAGPPVLGTAIGPAYAPNTPGAVPSALPVTPTADDLTQTVEVQFTEDISKTANELGRDPVKMYEFVRNTIDYEPYYGSRKGANETLWEKAGNDFDQASLLIALYRYSGIPARYVQGVVEIPIAKAMNWVGVEKPEAAAKLFSAAGVPSTALTSGGKITKLRIEHVWAEAYVPYESYRGAPGSQGKKQWVPLDASWKTYLVKEPTDAAAVTSFDAVAFAQHLVESVSVDATNGSVHGIDLGYVQGALAQAQQEASSYASSHAELTMEDVLKSRTLRGNRAGLLPSSLAFGLRTLVGEWREVPGGFRDAIVVAGPGFSFSASLPELAAKRLTLDYTITDEAERAIASSCQRFSDIPAHLVHASPYLMVEGRVEAMGEPLPLGDVHELTMTLVTPGTRDDVITDQLTVGGHYAVALDVGRISTETAIAQAHHFQGASQAILDYERAPGATLQPDEYFGESLYLPVLAYFSQIDVATRLTGRLLGVRDLRIPSVGMAGVSVAVRDYFGIPVSAELQGSFLDIDRDSVVAVDGAGGSSASRDLGYVTGLMGSELERLVWQDFSEGGRAVSATSLLRAASAQGVPVHVVDARNAASALGGLRLPDWIEADVRGAAAAGDVVVVPEHDVSVGRWSGLGYIVHDPSTGSSGFMLAGGIGGAETWYEDPGDLSLVALDIGRKVAVGALRVAINQLPATTAAVVGTALSAALCVYLVWAMHGLFERCVARIWATPWLSEEFKNKLSISAAVTYLLYVASVVVITSVGIVSKEVAFASQMGVVASTIITGLTLGLILPAVASCLAGQEWSAERGY
jgi:transglutaminase-like putative cysteine protease